MAFGQAAGPPASAKQIAYLESLLEKAGHESFRDARHPLGLTQRQAGGKFTKQEASELIERLQDGDGDVSDHRPSISAGQLRLLTASPPAPRSEDRAAERAQARRDEAVAAMPSGDLAAELTRRGWTCSPPP